MSADSRAAGVVALGESRQLAAAVAREAGLPLLGIEERSFAGGEFKLRPLESVRGRALYVLQSLVGTEEAPVAPRVLRLLFLLQGLRDAGAETTLLAPYLAFARKDVRTQPRDPVSSRYIAELLETTGLRRMVGLDVHNPAAFDNAFRIPTDHLTARPMMADHFARRIDATARIAVVSPDVGGIKRAQLFRERLAARLGRDVDIAFIEKRRAHDVVRSGGLTGDVADRDAIVIDDLCATGGTLIRAAETCRQAGALRVRVAVTHAALPGGLAGPLASDAISELVVTDSAVPPGAAQGRGIGAEKLTTLSIAPLFGRAVRRILDGKPLAGLLERWPVSGDD